VFAYLGVLLVQDRGRFAVIAHGKQTMLLRSAFADQA
jgi:hypothetical protein